MNTSKKNKKILIILISLLTIVIIISAIYVLKGKTCIFGHHYVPATCQKPQTCALCKITTGKTMEHNYVQTNIVEATCLQEGKKRFECSDCSSCYEESITIKEHEFKNGFCVMCDDIPYYESTEIPDFGQCINVKAENNLKWLYFANNEGKYTMIKYPLSAVNDAAINKYIEIIKAHGFTFEKKLREDSETYKKGNMLIDLLPYQDAYYVSIRILWK